MYLDFCIIITIHFICKVSNTELYVCRIVRCRYYLTHRYDTHTHTILGANKTNDWTNQTNAVHICMHVTLSVCVCIYFLIKFTIVWLSVLLKFVSRFQLHSCRRILHRFDSVCFIISSYIETNSPHMHVLLNSHANICVASALAFWLLEMATLMSIWTESHGDGMAIACMVWCGDRRNKANTLKSENEMHFQWENPYAKKRSNSAHRIVTQTLTHI